MKRTRLLSVGLAAGAVGFTVAVALAGGSRQQVVTRPAPDHVYNVFADSDNPLGVGGEISLKDLQQVTKGCGVCTLPKTGADSLETVIHAWYRSDGIVAVDFADGLEVTFEPDPRTNDEYLTDTQDLLMEDKLYSFIELRGLKVLAHESGGSELSPATLAWIEDGYRVAVMGLGGQELSDLVAFATQLGT